MFAVTGFRDMSLSVFLRPARFFVVVFLFCSFAARVVLSAGEASLDSLVSVARENNYEIIAARERWNAARAKAAQERVWDNPRLILEYWSIPEGGLDFGAAPEKMYGISQMIPFPGKLRIKGRAAGSQAEAMKWEYRYIELKVTAGLKTAYAMYYYLHKSIETYRQSAEIMNSFSAVAQSRYIAGQAAQGDVIRSQVEAEKMSNMVITLEQEKEAVEAELRRLTGNGSGSKPGYPAENPVRIVAMNWDKIKAAVKASPEIQKAGANEGMAMWNHKSALMEYLPDFDVSLRRKTMDGQWAGSDVMVAAAVPLWFWRQSSGVKNMAAELRAARAEKKDMELMAEAKAREYFTKADTARRLVELYESGVIPKSEQALAVAQAAFVVGRSGYLEVLDTVRAYIDAGLERHGYVADYIKNTAMLEWLTGIDFSVED
ncbi:MAG: hypothetical protein A2219_04000 [Elusimicrobia bacterium RIFOXYA2_FULL_50_26]|nr:MAG: hypothetical protein A2219_04000 [Elusimicrobia bacterium RIFOXYA2_FULL_50_26]